MIPNPDGTTTLKWTFTGPLAPCESMTFLIDAHVTKCGDDWNKQNATAYACGEIVYDEDYTYVNVPVRKSDLNVTEITVNYDASSLGGRAVGPEPGTGVHTQCNNISAVIEEDNGVATGAFNVTFKVDGTTLCTVRVPGLAGGANKTVYCNCSWYPYAGDAFAINVTVDSNNEILESDETNNTMWNRGTVVSNGYKGDGGQGPDKRAVPRSRYNQSGLLGR